MRGAIKTISFEEAAELAIFGAKVLHPATLCPPSRGTFRAGAETRANPGVKGPASPPPRPRAKYLQGHCGKKNASPVVDVVALAC